jgi:hypothetical protein
VNPTVVAGNTNIAKDLALAPVRGALNFGTSVYNLVDTVAGDALPDADFNWLGKSETMGGQIVEEISEFALGFVPLVGVAGKLGRAGKAASLFRRGAKWTAQSKLGKVGESVKNLTLTGDAALGGIQGGLLYQEGEDRLANLIEKYPELENPVTSYLQQTGDEGEIEGRFKTALEQAGLSYLVGGALILGLKSVKAGRNALMAGADPDAAAAAATKASDVEAAIAKTYAPGAEKAAPVNEFPGLPDVDDETKKILTNFYIGGDDDALTEKGMRFVSQMFEEGKSKDVLRAMVSVIQDDLKVGQQALPDAVVVEQASQTLASALRLSPEQVNLYFHKAYTDISTIQAQANLIAHGAIVERFGMGFYDSIRAMVNDQNPDTIAKMLKAKNEYQGVLQSFDKIRSSLGSMLRWIGKIERGAYQSHNLMSLAEMTDEALQKQMADPKAAAELHKIFLGLGDGANAKSIRDLTSVERYFGIHHEYWINMGLLSAPKTAIANFMGNLTTTLLYPGEIAAGAVSQLAQGAGTGAGTAVRVMRPSTALKGYMHIATGIADSWSFMLRHLKTGVTAFEGPPLGEASMARKAITAEGLGVEQANLAKMVDYLGNVIRLPQKVLAGTDTFFKHLNGHVAAKMKLYDQAVDLGFAGKDADKYVTDKLNQLLDKSGSFYNRDLLAKRFHSEGKELLKDGRIDDLESFILTKLDEYEKNNGAVLEFAKDYAERSTFTQALPDKELVEGIDPVTGEAVSRAYGVSAQRVVDTAANAHPVFKMVLPFTKTPLNLLNTVGQRILPNESVPGLKSLHRQYFKDLTSGDPVKVAWAEGRVVTGAAMVSSGLSLAMSGKVTGSGPVNDNERKILEQTGWQPYSFVVDNEDGTKSYISYQRMDPLGTFFGLTADIMEHMKKSNETPDADIIDMITATSMAAANNLTNKSYLSGLDQISNVLSDPNRFGPKFFRKRVASYVPNVIRSAVGAFGDDPYMREARSVFDSIKASIPGLSSGVDVQRNLLGEPVEHKTLAPGVDYLNPIKVSRGGADKVMSEIGKMGDAFTPPRPTQADGMVNMLKYAGSNGQSSYDRFLELTGEVKIGGKTLRQKLEKLMESGEYSRLQETGLGEVDSPRSRLIRREVSRYRDAAMSATRKEFRQLDDDIRRVETGKRNLKLGRKLTIEDLMPTN